jgi:hypothetical protein
MSILNRPGWANKEIITEGRLHNDKLKERIGRMFDRLSLGYSPNHVIDKIAEYIKSKNGEKIDINKLSDDYIINVANSDFITKGRFTPSLKPSFASEYQNTNLNTDTQHPSNEPVTIDFSIDTQQKTQSAPAAPIGSLPSEDSEDAESYDNQEDDEKSISTQKIEGYLQGITDEQLEKYKSAWESNPNKDKFDTLKLIQQEIARRQESGDADPSTHSVGQQASTLDRLSQKGDAMNPEERNKYNSTKSAFEKNPSMRSKYAEPDYEGATLQGRSPEEQNLMKVKTFLKKLNDQQLKEFRGYYKTQEENDAVDAEIASRKGESAEEVETFDSDTADSEFSSEIQKQNQHRVKHPNYLKDKKVNHESVKLSPQAVNKLLKENYSKKKQHEFRIEQRYYGM